MDIPIHMFGQNKKLHDFNRSRIFFFFFFKFDDWNGIVNIYPF